MEQREREFHFTPADFERVRKLIYKHAGISLAPIKQDMVYSRLARRLRALGYDTFEDYLAFLEPRGGLDALVEERGTNFSAGERQLLAFARALYRDAPYLVLDEATANVDSETEARLESAAGEVIEVPINGDDIFGPRDESLVFTDSIDNVPEEYRKVGTSILMENDQGQTRSFLVTRLDDESLTVDGNNPLCGRLVLFTLEILAVRDATDAELKAGGAIPSGPDIDPSRLRPVS